MLEQLRSDMKLKMESISKLDDSCLLL